MSRSPPPVAPSPATTHSHSHTSAIGFLRNGWRAVPDGSCQHRKSLIAEDDDHRRNSAHNYVVRHPVKVFVERIQRPLVFVFKKSHEKTLRHSAKSSRQFSVHDVINHNFTVGHNSGAEVTSSSRERAFRRADKSKLAEDCTSSTYRTSVKTTKGLAGWPSGIAKKGYEYFSLKPAMSAIFGTPSLTTVDESPSENTESIQITEIPDSPIAGSRRAETEPTPSDGPANQRSDADDLTTTTAAVVSPSQRRRRKHGYCLDVEEVKVLTTRLNLVTRRPSVQAWRQEHLLGNGTHFAARLVDVTQGADVSAKDDHAATKWSPEFRDRINASLDWLKSELTSMKEEDAILARRLLNIRKDIYRLKLSMCTERHRMILDEAMEIEEERDEIEKNRDCDITPEPFSPTLKQYGVTRMNIHSRRFSVF